jgi:hypothetical protein
MLWGEPEQWRRKCLAMRMRLLLLKTKGMRFGLSEAKDEKMQATSPLSLTAKTFSRLNLTGCLSFQPLGLLSRITESSWILIEIGSVLRSSIVNCRGLMIILGLSAVFMVFPHFFVAYFC